MVLLATSIKQMKEITPFLLFYKTEKEERVLTLLYEANITLTIGLVKAIIFGRITLTKGDAKTLNRILAN